jgi:hypothetical protein
LRRLALGALRVEEVDWIDQHLDGNDLFGLRKQPGEQRLLFIESRQLQVAVDIADGRVVEPVAARPPHEHAQDADVPIVDQVQLERRTNLPGIRREQRRRDRDRGRDVEQRPHAETGFEHLRIIADDRLATEDTESPQNATPRLSRILLPLCDLGAPGGKMPSVVPHGRRAGVSHSSNLTFRVGI